MRRALVLLAASTLALALVAVRSIAAVPQRTRWVGTHGIEVAVPAAWRLNRGMCGTPKANTVLWNEDGVLECATRQPPGLSVVEFGSFLERRHGWYRRHTTAVTVDGASARQWSAGTRDGSHVVNLAFFHRGITVTMLSPDRSLLRRLLASVRIVRADESGCPTRPPRRAYRLGSRPSGSGPFVPAGALDMVGCSYHGIWLDRSKRIGRREARRLARSFEAAPRGFSHAHRGSVLPSTCVPSWRGSLIVARFVYAHRPPAIVSAHLSGCSRLGASNGRWAIRLRPAWVHRLVDDANYFGEFLEY